MQAAVGVRMDHYTEFGTAWSPSAWLSGPVAGSVRFRVAVARAFRVPSFTERYYRDPANEARPDLRAERGHGVDGGLDWTRGRWSARATASARWDQDVIDWVRPNAQEVWRTTNVRDVESRSLELTVSRRWADAQVGVSYTYLSVDAPAISLLSKYVLEYAPHAIGVQMSAPVGARLRAGLTVDARKRLDGQRYTLVGLQLTRPFTWGDVFVAATNLLNEEYREIAGVQMPGRWAWAGIRLRQN
jgi:iron complex outermembrane receptor protein